MVPKTRTPKKSFDFNGFAKIIDSRIEVD